MIQKQIVPAVPVNAHWLVQPGTHCLAKQHSVELSFDVVTKQVTKSQSLALTDVQRKWFSSCSRYSSTFRPFSPFDPLRHVFQHIFEWTQHYHHPQLNCAGHLLSLSLLMNQWLASIQQPPATHRRHLLHKELHDANETAPVECLHIEDGCFNPSWKTLLWDKKTLVCFSWGTELIRPKITNRTVIDGTCMLMHFGAWFFSRKRTQMRNFGLTGGITGTSAPSVGSCPNTLLRGFHEG